MSTDEQIEIILSKKKLALFISLQFLFCFTGCWLQDPPIRNITRRPKVTEFIGQWNLDDKSLERIEDSDWLLNMDYKCFILKADSTMLIPTYKSITRGRKETNDTIKGKWSLEKEPNYRGNIDEKIYVLNYEILDVETTDRKYFIKGSYYIYEEEGQLKLWKYFGGWKYDIHLDYVKKKESTTDNSGSK
jgi:hypothetical protein